MPSAAAQLPSSSRSSLGVEPGGSWLSLLARTSRGVERVAAVMVSVSLGKVKLGAGPFRLIVQSYRSKETRGASPLGSVQRVVTAADLKRGVRLSLVELGAASSDEPYLVAWLEAGDATLELDGRRARPGRGAVVAMARAVRGLNPVTLVLGLEHSGTTSPIPSLRRREGGPKTVRRCQGEKLGGRPSGLLAFEEHCAGESTP